jgi:hypothetical protein
MTVESSGVSFSELEIFWLKCLKSAWQEVCYICFLSGNSIHTCQLFVYHHTSYHLNGRTYGPVTELHSPVDSICSLCSVGVGDWLPSELFCCFPLPFQATVRVVLELGYNYISLDSSFFSSLFTNLCINLWCVI